MADIITDAELRKELTELTGDNVGPITDSTRSTLLKRLQKLRGGNKPSSYANSKKTQGGSNNKAAVARSTPNLNNFGFSSDEEQYDMQVSSSSASIKTSGAKKKPTAAAKASTSKSRSAPHLPSEEQLLKLSNEEIQSQIFIHTGKRYPVTDSTKSVHVRRLRKSLASGEVAANARSLETSSQKSIQNMSKSGALPMETAFSDSDDGDYEMDFETSPEVSLNNPSSSNRPPMVNQSVNTSSFLDRSSLPDPPDDDSECFVVPSYPSQAKAGSQISSTSKAARSDILPDLPAKLPSPNLSSTRRSFIPASAFNSPGYSKPVPPSPPRSNYARRPLASGTNYASLNPEVTPKPTSRFAAAMGRSKPSKPMPARDYTTSYSTGSGKVISPPPSTRAKVAKDVDMAVRNRGKHPSYVYSKALVIGLALLLAIPVLIYLYLKLTTPEPLENVFSSNDIYHPLLEGAEKCSKSPCFTEAKLRDSKPLVPLLQTYLAQHAGRYECGQSGYEERHVAHSVARKSMGDLYGKDAVHLWDAVLNLIALNPHWNIRLLGQDSTKPIDTKQVWWLESVDAIKPWMCIISNAMTRVTGLIVGLLIVATLGYLAYMYGDYRKRQQQKQQDLFYELVENIIDLLEAQYKLSRENVTEDPFLAISHVHDTLINPADRVRMQAIWKKAVTFIKDNETRVREEVQQVQGEEFQVWRWLQSADPKPSPKRAGWDGSAVGSQKINFRPTLCLKIRGMFDIYSESGNEWPIEIQDAILEKLGNEHGVVHIAVDTDSDENRVYAKFDTAKHAGKAFESLNGSYYAGQCVQCKFLLPKKYHQRFPSAEHSAVPLRRSNQQPLTKPGANRLYPQLQTYQ